MFKGKFPGMDSSIVDQFRNAFEAYQDEVHNLTVKTTSGAGMVTVLAQGDGTITEITITPEAMAEEPTVLGDLIKSAVNNARTEIDDALRERLKQIPIPGDLSNLSKFDS